MAMASVRAGSATLCIFTPLEITGNTGIQMENRYISSSATKKFGRLLPTKLHSRIRRSVKVFCFTAERIPRGMEITTVSRMEAPVRSSVAGSLERKVENTSSPEI